MSVTRRAVALAAFGAASLAAPWGGAQPLIERPVTDAANVLSDADEGAIAQRLVAHRAATGVQVAVLTVTTTSGVPIEDYSMRVAERWRGGAAGANNGVLYVLAVQDRKHRLEVGYGLESTLTDARSRAILDGARGSLRASDHAGAVRAVVDGVIGATGGTVVHEPAADPANAPAPQGGALPAPVTYVPPSSPPPAIARADADGGLWAVLLCFGPIGLAVGLIGWLLVKGLRRAGGAAGASSDGMTYGSSGNTSWSDTSSSSWPSSDSSSSSWSSSDSSSSSSSDSGWSGGGGDFGGGGASSDW